MGYWNTRRTDWVTSVGMLSRGDFVYYDWTGDGVWDHVAVVAGTNSAGQKVIDAHTTDHYHVYWKLGYSGTKYKYARVRAQWVVVDPQRAPGTRSCAARSSAVSRRRTCTSSPAAVTAKAAAVGRALYWFIISSV